MEIVRRQAFHLEPGQGVSVWSLGGRFTVKLDATASAGQFAVVEALAFRSTEPPVHIHRNEDEAWYILDGAMTFYVDGGVYPATTGSFVYAPRGLPHGFTVDIEPTRVLVFASPSGFEQFALEVGEPATGDEPPADLSVPPPEVLGPIGHKYGIEIVGPPIRIAKGLG